MKTVHGVVLLAVALLALSSEIIVSARMVAREGDTFPPESTCSKVIDIGRRCEADKCSGDCSRELKGISSQCGAAGCMCWYFCDPPPPVAAN